MKRKLFVIIFLLLGSICAYVSVADAVRKQASYISDQRKSASWYNSNIWKQYVFSSGDINAVEVGGWLKPQDFSKYSAVIFMAGDIKSSNAVPWSDADVKVVEDYIRNGGVLILADDSALWLSGNNSNTGRLKNLLGANGFDSKKSNVPVKVNETDGIASPLKGVPGGWYAGSFSLTGITAAVPLISSADGKKVFASVNKLGNGKVFFFGNDLFALFKKIQTPSIDPVLYSKMLTNAVLAANPQLSTLKKEKWESIPLGKLAGASPPVSVELWLPPAAYDAFGKAPPLYVVNKDGAKSELVKNSTANCVIITANKPSAAAEKAAAVTAHYLEAISGAVIPVVSENNIAGTAAGKIKIVIGDCKLAASAGLNSKTLPPEGILLKTVNNSLFILGSDESGNGIKTYGTLYAALTFLEKYLGIRWLWPGEAGTIVQKSADITIPEINEQYAPVMEQRKIRSVYYVSEDKTPLLQALGINEEKLKARNTAALEWLLMQKTGARINYKPGHAYGDYWARYSKSHPEWFALQRDGTRDQGPLNYNRSRLCVSSPGLAEQIAENACIYFKNNPDDMGFSICPNDGGRPSFCMCSECRKMDPADASPITLEYRIPDSGSFSYVSLTNREFTFFNKIADIVSKRCPGKKLIAYAYNAYSLPPAGGLKAHPDLVVGIVAFNYVNEDFRKESMLKYKEWNAAAQKIFLRPNAFYVGRGLPLVYPHRMAADVKSCIKDGLTMIDYDGCLHNWSTQGLNYYVLAKVLWNPDVNVDSVIDDFCEKGFGNAAPYIRQYFNLLEEKTDRLAASNVCKNVKEEFDRICYIFNPELTARSESLLSAAKDAVKGNKEIIERINFLETGLEYAKIRYITRGRPETPEVADYFKKIGLSWAVNGVSNRVNN